MKTFNKIVAKYKYGDATKQIKAIIVGIELETHIKYNF